MQTNALLNAMTTADTFTENGCLTNSTTSSDCVDLFFTIGAMRSNRNDKSKMRDLVTMFDRAFAENPLVAMKILFWSRDIRGGVGEREIFRKIWKHITDGKNNQKLFLANMANFPEYGRWDDLFGLITKDSGVEDQIIEYIIKTLKNSDIANSILEKIDEMTEEECEIELKKVYGI